jgi:PEP-CTERM motif
MKLRLLICTVLLALLAVPAFADSLSFTNQGFETGGQLLVSSSGVGATNAMITSFSVNGSLIASGDLGALSFDTGIFTGSLPHGGSFTGGTFSIGAVVFNGFAGTLTNIGEGLYDLVGTFSGTFDGTAFTGTTNQIFSFSGDDDHGRHNNGDDNCWHDLHGTTTLTTGTATVPEPGTLTFFGTGLIALAGVVRRKLAGRI